MVVSLKQTRSHPRRTDFPALASQAFEVSARIQGQHFLTPFWSTWKRDRELTVLSMQEGESKRSPESMDKEPLSRLAGRDVYCRLFDSPYTPLLGIPVRQNNKDNSVFHGLSVVDTEDTEESFIRSK